MTCTDCAKLSNTGEPIQSYYEIRLCPLHAAAPQMLEALRFITKHNDCMARHAPCSPEEHNMMCHWCIARQAIQAATKEGER